MSEYILNVKATDNGTPALSSTIHVHIIVTMADNAPPRYDMIVTVYLSPRLKYLFIRLIAV